MEGDWSHAGQEAETDPPDVRRELRGAATDGYRLPAVGARPSAHTVLVGDGNTRAQAGPGLCFFAGVAEAMPVTASARHPRVPMMPLAGRGTEEQMGVLLLHFPPGTPSPRCKTVGLKNEGGRPHPHQI